MTTACLRGSIFTDGTLLGNRNVLDATPTGAYRGLKRIQFTGGMPGYVAAMTRFPDQQFTVICLCNNSTISPWQINARIADLYLANDLEPVQKKFDGEAVRRAEDKEIKLDEAELLSKTGAFRLRADGRIWKTVFQDGRLLVIDHLNEATPLIPMGHNRFQPDGGFFHETARFEFTQTSPESPFSLISRWIGGTVGTDRVDLVAELEEIATAPSHQTEQSSESPTRWIVTPGEERLVKTQVLAQIKSSLLSLLRRPDCDEAHIDLSHVEYLGNTAIGMLLSVHQQSAAADTRLVLCRMKPQVREQLTSRRFDKVFNIQQL